MTPSDAEDLKARVEDADRLLLFLDYDGTLADFAPTPEQVKPDPEVIALVTQLAKQPHVRVMVVSGRRLDHIETLLPVPGVLLAGTYGVELRLPKGDRLNRVRYDKIRPLLKKIKPRWEKLIGQQEGFFLEDKDWALAIHARHASDIEAEGTLEQARNVAAMSIKETTDSQLFRILGGDKFLEVGPTLAHKGKTVDYLLSRYPSPGALPVYVGDDDKDEEAFGVIHAYGGLAIKVCEEPCDTQADSRLGSPHDVRRWLETVATQPDP